jgi:hypothetical protein
MCVHSLSSSLPSALATPTATIPSDQSETLQVTPIPNHLLLAYTRLSLPRHALHSQRQYFLFPSGIIETYYQWWKYRSLKFDPQETATW